MFKEFNNFLGFIFIVKKIRNFYKNYQEINVNSYQASSEKYVELSKDLHKIWRGFYKQMIAIKEIEQRLNRTFLIKFQES